MARRRKTIKKTVSKDPLYDSPVVGTMISTVMEEGKKSIAQKIVYDAIALANGKEAVNDPLEILHKAIDSAKPRLEVKSRRVGGATYQVPMEVSAERQLAVTMRWIVGFAKKKKGIPMAKALANEIKDAAQGQGNAIKRRDEVHRMAQANRAFAHLRW